MCPRKLLMIFPTKTLQTHRNPSNAVTLCEMKENIEAKWIANLIYRIFYYIIEANSMSDEKNQWNRYYQKSKWIIYSDMASVRRVTFPIHIDLDYASLVLNEVAWHLHTACNITLGDAASLRLSQVRMWLNRNRKQHRRTPDVYTACSA